MDLLSKYFNLKFVCLNLTKSKRRTKANQVSGMDLSDRNPNLTTPNSQEIATYQFRVMFSVLTTTAYVARCTWSSSRAKSTEMTPALHPMPPKLYDLIFPRSLYLFIIIAESEGVGLNRLQFTTKIPMSFGFTLVEANKLSSAPNITWIFFRREQKLA